MCSGAVYRGVVYRGVVGIAVVRIFLIDRPSYLGYVVYKLPNQVLL